MHLHGLTLAFLLPSLALYAADSAIAIPSEIASPADLLARNPTYPGLMERAPEAVGDSPPLLYVRDGDEDVHGHGHGHGHGHAAPIVQLNESEILLDHAPTPPSYWTIDIDESHPGNNRHPSLMALHALFMIFAFLGALPAGLSWQGVLSVPF
jgi:hypothetical protein